MNTRIVAVRKHTGLTQEQFADRINLSRNYLWMLENGSRTPSDRTISDICREFGVREAWLRTGEGEMFAPAPTSALEALVAERSLTSGDRILIEKFMNLKPETRQEILQYIQQVAAAMEEGSAPTSGAISDAEAAYEKTLGIAQNTQDASVSSTTADMDGTG